MIFDVLHNTATSVNNNKHGIETITKIIIITGFTLRQITKGWKALEEKGNIKVMVTDWRTGES